MVGPVSLHSVSGQGLEPARSVSGEVLERSHPHDPRGRWAVERPRQDCSPAWQEAAAPHGEHLVE